MDFFCHGSPSRFSFSSSLVVFLFQYILPPFAVQRLTRLNCLESFGSSIFVLSHTLQDTTHLSCCISLPNSTIMAPSATPAIAEGATMVQAVMADGGPKAASCLLDRTERVIPRIVRSKGSRYTVDSGETYIDASGGAAVACIGQSDPRPFQAMAKQAQQASYCHPGHFSTSAPDDLARFLCESTGYRMKKVWLCNSGTDDLSFLIPVSSISSPNLCRYSCGYSL